MSTVESLLARCLLIIYCLTGLMPLPLPNRQRLIFTLIVRCSWLIYFVLILCQGISFFWKYKSIDIGFINGTTLYICYSLLGIMLQLESALQRKNYEHLQDLRMQSQLQLQRLGMWRRGRKTWGLLCHVLVQIVCDVAKSWANAHATSSPIHLISMPQKWLLRFRYIQLLEQVMELNQRAYQLRHSLLHLAAGNDIWQPFGGLDECSQLQTLRLSYECIYECYECFSDCYGWGMLCLQLMCGYEFVSNAYWIITETYSKQRLYTLVYNSATCYAMGVLIMSLFWYGDAGAENVIFWKVDRITI